MKNDTSKFIIDTSIFLVLFALIFSIYVLACYSYADIPIEDTSFLHARVLTKKELAATYGNENKLIILAGSSGANGFNSQMMEDQLNIPVFNASLVGGTKKYLFHYAQKIANPGDTIFIPLEYSFYTFNNKSLFNLFETTSTMEDYVRERDQAYLNDLPLIDRIGLTTINARELVAKIIKSQHYIDTVEEKLTNAQNAYNQAGDINPDIRRSKDRIKQILKIKYENKIKLFPQTIKDIEQIDISSYDGTKNLEEFFDWCNENSIRVIAGYPPVIDFRQVHRNYYDRGLKQIEQFYKEHDIPSVGTPYDFFYPNNYFFDTFYHLHYGGRIEHTQNVIDKLKEIL